MPTVIRVRPLDRRRLFHWLLWSSIGAIDLRLFSRLSGESCALELLGVATDQILGLGVNLGKMVRLLVADSALLSLLLGNRLSAKNWIDCEN